MSDISYCRNCGVDEHIHLLDAKNPDGDENGDFTVLECIACYGAGWLPTAGPSDFALSVAPRLRWRYRAWLLREKWRNARRTVRNWHQRWAA